MKRGKSKASKNGPSSKKSDASQFSFGNTSSYLTTETSAGKKKGETSRSKDKFVGVEKTVKSRPKFDDVTNCGLANQFLFVDQEKDGIWKVSTPSGERFSKRFLAGMEVWVNHMWSGKKIILQQPTTHTDRRVESHISPKSTYGIPQPPQSEPQAPSTPLPLQLPCLDGMLPGLMVGKAQAGGDRTTPLANLRSSAPISIPMSAAKTASKSGCDADEQQAADSIVGTTLVPSSSPAEGLQGREREVAESEASCSFSNSYLAGESPPTANSSWRNEQGITGRSAGHSGEVSQNEDEVILWKPSVESPSKSIRSDGVERDAGNPAVPVFGGAEALLQRGSVASHEDYGGSPSSSSSSSVSSPAPPAQKPQQPPVQPPRSAMRPVVTEPVASSAGTSHRAERTPMVAQHSVPRTPVRCSIHLEGQNLTDMELELLRQWYVERMHGKLEIVKLWLFNNRIGDEGAKAVAGLVGPELTELHLSHNFVGTEGAKAVIAAIPTKRPVSAKPLWLRLEWNMVDPEALLTFVTDQQALRGLLADIPKAFPDKHKREHELNLRIDRSVRCHFRLPWIASQKQPPEHAQILRNVTGEYARSRQSRAEAAMQLRPEPPPRKTQPLAAAAPEELVPSVATTAPPLLPSTSQDHSSEDIGVSGPSVLTRRPSLKSHPLDNTKSRATPVPKSISDPMPSSRSTGPLLIFPDTSALISMLGANSDLPRPLLSLTALESLANQGRFGRGLHTQDQTFLVLCDSVMKQLDGLKSVYETRTAVRKFLATGLDSMGPSGHDFLTVLGAHEGEGVVLAASSEGLAGSRSPYVSSKGQAVDTKIVEVALFFLHEVQRAAGWGAHGSEGFEMDAEHMPVVLLSNDNAQVAAAKAHGLPAFRLASLEEQRQRVTGLLAGGGPVTSGDLRKLIGEEAMRGLGTMAGKALQEQFDESVATARTLLSTLSAATFALRCISDVSSASRVDASVKLSCIRNLKSMDELTEDERTGTAAEQDPLAESHEDPSAPPLAELVESLSEMAQVVESQVQEWESQVRILKGPNRVLKWAAGASR